jgi:hypothetical protein
VTLTLQSPQVDEIERLQRHTAQMATALLRAHRQFLYYEQQHRAKGTSDSTRKAEVNASMAQMCADALVAPRPC